jgi:hypothetical protein
LGTIALEAFKASGILEVYTAQGASLDDASAAYNGDDNPPADLTTVPPIMGRGISETFEYYFPA